jgi:hypothetical protein
VDKNYGRIEFAIVVRDYERFVLAARSTTRNVAADPVVAEALASLHAVKLCREMGFNNSILEGDALQIVMTIKVESNNLSKFRHIVHGIKESLHHLKSWRIVHVKRSANAAAHSTVRERIFCAS